MRLAGLTYGVVALISPTLAAAERAGTHPDRQLITTQGRGEVRVQPDSLRVQVGVEVQAETLERARDEANRRARGILDALNDLKIPGLTLRTQALELTVIRAAPRENELPPIVGYRAVNSISATVIGAPPEALGDFGSRIVDAAVAAGANVAGGIGFFVKNLRTAQDRALAAAVRDAARSARILARAAGVRLGRLHSLEGAPSFQGGFLARAGAALEVAPTPLAVGETAVTSSISARFTFRSR